jgi:hypothetical protein
MNKDSGREIGKFFVDVAKLVFGGAVLAAVLKIEGMSNIKLAVSGILVTTFLVLVGFIIIVFNEENKKN